MIHHKWMNRRISSRRQPRGARATTLPERGKGVLWVNSQCRGVSSCLIWSWGSSWIIDNRIFRSKKIKGVRLGSWGRRVQSRIWRLRLWSIMLIMDRGILFMRTVIESAFRSKLDRSSWGKVKFFQSEKSLSRNYRTIPQNSNNNVRPKCKDYKYNVLQAAWCLLLKQQRRTSAYKASIDKDAAATIPANPPCHQANPASPW